MTPVVHDRYDVAGHLVDVGAPPGEVHAAVRSIFRGFGPAPSAPGVAAPRWEIAQTQSGEWEIACDGAPVRTSRTSSEGLAALEWHLVTAALDRRHDLFHLHGAALCARGQRAGVALVGHSGSGKTTLALRLMREGFTPFSDDVALMDPATLEVQPFRRSFHVSEDIWDLIGGAKESLEEQGGSPAGYFHPARWAHYPVPLRWLLFLERRPGVAPALTRLKPADAAPAILRRTLSLEPTPRLALAATARLTERAECYQFLVSDLEPSVALLLGLVAEAGDITPLSTDL